MSPTYIRVRITKPDRKTGKTSKRWIVYYRRGGRGFPEEYAGSFKTKTEAQIRRDLVAGELAAGRDPKPALERIKNPPAPKPGLLEQWDAFSASRHDVGIKAQRQYRNARDRWVPLLGEARDPDTITAQDVMDGVLAFMTEGPRKKLSPGTIGQYVSVLRQVLGYADVTPNPVDSKKVRLPKDNREEINPPSCKAWFAIRDHLRKRSKLALRLIECEGFRISEGVLLTYGDIDFIDGRIRVSRARTKTSSGQRWIPVPRSLLNEISDLVAPEDRHPARRVFPEIKAAEVRRDFAMACVAAGTTDYSPHDLRHRRISLWYRHGIDPIVVSIWAGHSNASMGLDVYGHVTIDHENDEWRDFWKGQYRMGPTEIQTPVRHQDVV